MSDYQEASTDEGLTKTCDLYLAAFFTAAGCSIVKTYLEGTTKVHFFFDNSEGLVERLENDFLTRSASINAAAYADNIKSLKALAGNTIDKAKGRKNRYGR
jgi:hypothetical protein